MFPSEIPHRSQEPLAKHTSYRIGGPAEVFALPRTKEHLWTLGTYLQKNQTPYCILGNGSNVVAPDEGIQGVVICTKELEAFLEFLPSQKVHASASTLNSRLLNACASQGLGGIEALSGVPGNLGGAIKMNAGTAEGWIEDALLEVELVQLKGGERKVPKRELVYSYREQHYMQAGELVYAATLQLRPEEPAQIKARLAESIRKRKAAQPIELPSCGSVFRNPKGQNAWKLIADAGLRGHKVGGARFSEKHCNFIVNEGGATKSDVLALIELAKEKVKAHSGVDLHEEVIVLQAQVLR